jgi:hypothetical protein
MQNKSWEKYWMEIHTKRIRCREKFQTTHDDPRTSGVHGYATISTGPGFMISLTVESSSLPFKDFSHFALLSPSPLHAL